MDWQRVASTLEKLIPIALIIGLLGDWLRLRFAHRAEERKHIARAISDLLQLRYIILLLPEFPKHLPELLPKELSDQLPPDFWRYIDFAKLVQMDEEFPKRYRKAVEEIAGFRPVLAYQLRDKERYFDLRNFLSHHAAQPPGNPLVANRITEAMDREALTTIDETLSLLAKAHSIHMRYSIWRTLHRRRFERNLIPPEIRKAFQEAIRQVVAAASSQEAKQSSEPNQPGS